MLVNANIKSKKELAQRLIDGEVFYYVDGGGRHKIWFDLYNNDHDHFRHDEAKLKACWGAYEDFQIEANWWDNIPEEGVLCWVSDTNPEEKYTAVLVVEQGEHGSYNYLDHNDCWWIYATPVLPEECLQQV